MKLDRLQTAVFAGALALAAWPALKPEPRSDFDLAAFARLPVLEGGRVKPLDSFARNTMLAMRSKQSVPVDGKALPPARWLLDAAFKPALADTYAAFVVDDPEVLGLIALDHGKTRYFAYWQLEGRRDEIQKQAALADEIEGPRRTRFQSAVLTLHGRLAMYERLKNTFMISGSGDPVMELAAFTTLLPAALKAFHAKKQSAADLRAMMAFSEMLQRYNFIAQTAAFKAIPPKEGADPDAWTNAGEAVVSPTGGRDPHPSLASFAIMGRAYRDGDAAAFNAALSEHTSWLAQYRPAAARAARCEALFNKLSPFTTGMALYILALLLIFAGWATRRLDVAAAARALAWAGFAVHTAGLLAHSVLQGRPPVTNLYSSAVFVGWAAVALGLFAERFHKRGFAAAGACVVGFTTLIVAHHLKSSGDTMEMMRAVLDSNFWLATHVVTITIGYSSTYLAGMLGIAWVVRRHLPLKPDPAASKALSELAYGVIAFSLFFSFIGTVLGGIWADQSWGRFWGWDPKENGALLIVLWNAFILHARWGGYARERGIMLMAIFGNIIVSLSWFGVNMLGIGLHSYGFMDKAFLWLSAFCALQLLLMLLGALLPRAAARGRIVAPRALMAKDNTSSAGLLNAVDRNTVVWWALLLASAALAATVSPWGGLFWLAALACDDVLFWVLGRAFLFDSELRVRRNYQWIHNMYDGTAGRGRDLGFNLVTDAGLSQRAKYEHMARKLGLHKGMAVCDVGCGYGDWLKYCRDELGCEAVGINLTPEQADYARREYALEVHTANWKDVLGDPELQAGLFGRFDAVTFMDTVEHYVSMEDRNDLEKQRRIYEDMCLLAARLLDERSPSRRVFLSCLHQTRRPRNWKFYWHAYFMDKMYSGHYPFVDAGPLAACRRWFNVASVEDKTEDYRLTGVRDRRHFQAVSIRLTPRKLAYAAMLLFLDPHVVHRVLYYFCDSWMFFYGEDPYSPRYDPERRRAVSYVLLYWITLELKPAFVPSNPIIDKKGGNELN